MLPPSSSATVEVFPTKCSDCSTLRQFYFIYLFFQSSNFDLCWAERSSTSVTASTWSIQAHAAIMSSDTTLSRPQPFDRRRGRDPMALTIRAKSPMNMYMHKNCWNRMLKQMYWTRTCTHEHLSCTDAIVHQTQLQLSIKHSGNIIHLYKHSFNMSIIIINSKYSCGNRNGQEHLSYE